MTTTQLVVALGGGAAAGALLTALASLFTGWLSRRHEHRRWLLDKRLEVYVSFNDAVTGWQVAHASHEIDLTTMTTTLQQLVDRGNALELIAPRATSAVAKDVARACHDAASLAAREAGDAATTTSPDRLAIVQRMVEQSDELLDLQRRDVQGSGWRRRLRR